MPWKLRPRCKQPGCTSLAAHGSTYCDTHKPKRPRTDADRQRDREREFGYNDAEWKRVRKLVLKRDGFICRACGERAVLVHHEPPLDGPDDPGRNDPHRCVSMCRRCHEVTHKRMK